MVPQSYCQLIWLLVWLALTRSPGVSAAEKARPRLDVFGAAALAVQEQKARSREDSHSRDWIERDISRAKMKGPREKCFREDLTESQQDLEKMAHSRQAGYL